MVENAIFTLKNTNYGYINIGNSSRQKGYQTGHTK